MHARHVCVLCLCVCLSLFMSRRLSCSYMALERVWVYGQVIQYISEGREMREKRERGSEGGEEGRRKMMGEREGRRRKGAWQNSDDKTREGSCAWIGLRL